MPPHEIRPFFSELAQLMQEQTHRTTLGPFPEQRTLRPADDFNAVDVEQQRTHFAKVALQAMQRGVVDE